MVDYKKLYWKKNLKYLSILLSIWFAVSFVVSRVTQPAPEEVQELTETIRFPRGAGEAHDITIH